MIAAPEALELAESVPQEAPVQPAPESVQVTRLFCASLATVAVKGCAWLVCTFCGVGATVTEMGGVMVMEAEAVFEESA